MSRGSKTYPLVKYLKCCSEIKSEINMIYGQTRFLTIKKKIYVRRARRRTAACVTLRFLSYSACMWKFTNAIIPLIDLRSLKLNPARVSDIKLFR
ncbi:hypothetical protein PUN28_004808 [Cardiocondyla obscurior]|uniref:Uncharacterized protein n=1 Tax=Cardiocondyla obscurior TaxID=286306 RepID=A0AAW2GEG7_9HYME